MALNHSDKKWLLKLAQRSIAFGLEHGQCLLPDNETMPLPLLTQGAAFVTLEQHGQLRGCIGTLEARLPLYLDVCNNAYNAAFRDPRFPPLQESELQQLDIHISVLSKSEEITFIDEEDLIQKIRPGIDGLILEEGSHRGTFLPSVWESLPKPQSFLQHLKQKAGLPPTYWSDTLRIMRYTTEIFGTRFAR